jgi:hypothetical protein
MVANAASFMAIATIAGDATGSLDVLSLCAHNNCWLKYAPLLDSYFPLSIHCNINLTNNFNHL